MCGIFGIVDPKGKADHQSIINKASKLLAHRGPDDFGFLARDTKGKIKIGKSQNMLKDSKLSFLHKRLSILDLSKSGWQPIYTPDKKYYIVFNGEIYNYLELKKTLEKKGYVFKSSSDTEVLLYSYIEWGADCLNKFIGMFAFAILDLVKDTVFCARDFFGIKPFYYANKSNIFAFSSEIKPLLEIPEVTRQTNYQMIYEYLVYSQQEGSDRCFWRDVNQLPPAHYLVYDLKKNKIREIKKYWDLSRRSKTNLSLTESSDRVRELFTESVKLHLRSDVPIGANLSGGIDSSSIVMVAKKVSEAKLNLKTISFIAEEEAINEEKWIDIVNSDSGSIPIKVYPKKYDLTKDIESLVYTQEEPFGSTSPYAQSRVFKAIQEHKIKVVLDGQGADEMLAGYRSYLYVYMESLVRQKRYLKAFVLGWNIMQLPGVTLTIKNLLKLLSSYLAPVVKPSPPGASISLSSLPRWINGSWLTKQALAPFQWWRPLSNECMKEQLHYTFVNSSLPHLLRVADKNSMSYSVESRLPFLTPQLAEFVFSLPESHIVSLTAFTKSVFREAMNGIVSQEILLRKDKIGFTTPEELWLRSNKEWVLSILSCKTATQIPFLNAEEMKKEWLAMLENKVNFDMRFWRWINLILWSKIFKAEY